MANLLNRLKLQKSSNSNANNATDGAFISKKVAGKTPFPRHGFTAVAVPSTSSDTSQNDILIFGGMVQGQAKHDTVIVSMSGLMSFQNPYQTTGTPPPDRVFHAVCVVASQQKMYLYGGVGANHTYDEYLYSINAQSRTWSRPRVAGKIIPRHGHAMAALGDVIYITGGTNTDKEYFGDFLALDVGAESLAWSKIEVGGVKPCTRAYHTMTEYGTEKLVMFGGECGYDTLDDLWVFDKAAVSWTQLHADGEIPTARYHHAACIVNATLWIAGGMDMSGTHLDDVWCFNFTSETWTIMGTMPQPRSELQICCIKEKIYVFGGHGEKESHYDQVYVIDPVRFKPAAKKMATPPASPQNSKPKPKIQHFVNQSNDTKPAPGSVSPPKKHRLTFLNSPPPLPLEPPASLSTMQNIASVAVTSALQKQIDELTATLESEKKKAKVLKEIAQEDADKERKVLLSRISQLKREMETMKCKMDDIESQKVLADQARFGDAISSNTVTGELEIAHAAYEKEKLAVAALKRRLDASDQAAIAEVAGLTDQIAVLTTKNTKTEESLSQLAKLVKSFPESDTAESDPIRAAVKLIESQKTLHAGKNAFVAEKVAEIKSLKTSLEQAQKTTMVSVQVDSFPEFIAVKTELDNARKLMTFKDAEHAKVVESLKADAQHLEKKIAAQRSVAPVADLSNDFEKMKKQVYELESQNREKTKVIANLAGVDSERYALEIEVKNWKEEALRMTQLADQANKGRIEALDQCQNTLQTGSARNTEMEEQYKSVTAENAVLLESLKELESKVSQLTSQVDEAKSVKPLAGPTFENENKELKKHVAELESRVKDLSEQQSSTPAFSGPPPPPPPPFVEFFQSSLTSRPMGAPFVPPPPPPPPAPGMSTPVASSPPTLTVATGAAPDFLAQIRAGKKLKEAVNNLADQSPSSPAEEKKMDPMSLMLAEMQKKKLKAKATQARANVALAPKPTMNDELAKKLRARQG